MASEVAKLVAADVCCPEVATLTPAEGEFLAIGIAPLAWLEKFGGIRGNFHPVGVMFVVARGFAASEAIG